MKMIKQPTIPPMPKRPTFDARDTQYNLPIGTDCISRQQAIDAIDGYMEKLRIHIATPNDTESYSYARGLLVGVINDIKQLPPIQPKRGRWHYSDGKPARIGLSFGVICDQCGTESEYCTNFCGECGADMRGEQDGRFNQQTGGD